MMQHFTTFCRIQRENAELRIKLAAQQEILRGNIEKMRMNALRSGDPREVEKAEQNIRDILTRHGLDEGGLCE